jgi:hypothetical protein
MNFRFAHYDPPKEDKKRPRKPNNATKTSHPKTLARSTKAQVSNKQRSDSGPNSSIREPERPSRNQQDYQAVTAASASPVRVVALRNTNDAEPSAFDFSNVDHSTSSTRTSIFSFPDDHETPSSVTSSTMTPLGYYDHSRLPNMITSLGEGRIDPFHMYPVDYVTPYVHMLIDHGTLVTLLNGGLR